MTGNLKFQASKKEKNNILISSALTGAGFGALAGTLIWHINTVYVKQIESIGFHPVIVPDHSGTPLIGISFSFNLR